MVTVYRSMLLGTRCGQAAMADAMADALRSGRAKPTLARVVIVHSPKCLEYQSPGHPERPGRVRSLVDLLRNGRHEWIAPSPARDADLLRVHAMEHLLAVRTGDYHDGDTPFFAQIDEIARLAAGAAIDAAEQALSGKRAFSAMRPPGHHAERNHIMGFCYFNNIAVAVARALDEKQLRRVAILDFDCHHGNGTEQIFLGNERVRFVSLHQSPCYPGTGLASSEANCFNFPLPPETGPDEFLRHFDRALERVTEFQPELLAISAGFDMYQCDPITQMGLEIETFGEIGRRIGKLSMPQFAVLEGGYAHDLAECVAAFVTGWESRA